MNCSARLRELARAGLSMIIVEQKPKKILPFTDEAIVLDRGAIAYAAPSAELIANPAALDAHLTATKKARVEAAGNPSSAALARASPASGQRTPPLRQ